eukprot:7450349-Heterocapsa_arctica.AAC.1
MQNEVLVKEFIDYHASNHFNRCSINIRDIHNMSMALVLVGVDTPRIIPINKAVNQLYGFYVS